MNFCFRSSSELQGEVDPTWQIAAFQTDLFYNPTLVYDLQLWRSDSFIPEVGDLHLSSEGLGPSLESQSAAEATKMGVTLGISHSKLAWAKARPTPTSSVVGIIKGHLYKQEWKFISQV